MPNLPADLSRLLDPPEVDLDRPWEPRTFKVGDRVRVRLSGECRKVFTIFHVGTNQRLHEATHLPELDGATGTVVPRVRPARFADHPYFVCLDCPVQTSEGRLCRASFAAVELEPLDEEPADAR